jgi:hypothetical protein
MKEQVFKLTEMALKNEIIKKRAQVADNILSKVLEESKLSDLLSKYKEFSDQINQLNSASVPFPLIQWTAKYLSSKPPENSGEVINVVIVFNKNKQKIAAKHGNAATDIFKYKSLSDIQNIILSLDQEQSRDFYQAEENEYDIIFENEKWKVIFPKTKKASIYFGHGTSWCTAYKAATGGLQNQFIYYSSANIFLSYFINKETNTPYINIGFQQGQPVFDETFGGVSVYGNNNGVKRAEFTSFANNNLKEPNILNIIHAWYTQKYNNQHPIAAKKYDQDFIFDILKSDHIAGNEMLDSDGYYSQNFMFQDLYREHRKNKTSVFGIDLDQKIVDYFYNKKNGIVFIAFFSAYFKNNFLNNFFDIVYSNNFFDITNLYDYYTIHVRNDHFVITNDSYSWKFAWPSGLLIPDSGGYINFRQRFFGSSEDQNINLPIEENFFADPAKPIFVANNIKFYAEKDPCWGLKNTFFARIDTKKQMVFNNREYFLSDNSWTPREYPVLKGEKDNYIIVNKNQNKLNTDSFLIYYDFDENLKHVIKSDSYRINAPIGKLYKILELENYYCIANQYLVPTFIEKNMINSKEELIKKIILFLNFSVRAVDDQRKHEILQELENNTEQFAIYSEFINTNPAFAEATPGDYKDIKINEIIKKRAQVADNILSKLLQEIKMEQVLPRFESKAFLDAIDKINIDVLKYAQEKNSDPNNYYEIGYNRFNQDKAKEICELCIPNDINEKYKAEALNWIITKFIDGKFLFFNHSNRSLNNTLTFTRLRAIHALETFYQLKQLNLNRFLKETDIYKIKSVADLLDISIEAGKLFMQYNEEKSYNKDWQKGANLIYEDDNWKIYIPENKAAACHLGKGTDWCTAAPGLNYYENYHQPDDPLIIFINKKDPTEKYQCNLLGGSFMDKDDRTISRQMEIKLKSLLKNAEYIKQRPNLFEVVKDLDYAELPNGGHYLKEREFVRFLDSKGKHFTFYVKAIADLENKDIKEYTKYTEFAEDKSSSEVQVKTETGIYHFNLLEQLHRNNDLPAIEYFDGSKKWYRKGQLHRLDGPAVINSDGTEEYYILGMYCPTKLDFDELCQSVKKAKIFENKQPSSISESIFNETKQLLEESKLSVLLSKYKEFAEQIDILNKNGTPYPLIEWAAKYMSSKPPEGLNEIVDVVIAFNKNKQKIAAKHGNAATDIFKYKTLSQIQNIILSLNQEQTRDFYQAEQSEYDVIFENEDWKVIFPKTKKASIYFGDGTSWCTAYKAATGGLQNQYIYYSSTNIFLSYFINKKADKAEINVGFKNGEPIFDERFGGVSVLANNNGITRESFDKFANEVLKQPNVLDIIKDWYQKHYNNEHPIVSQKNTQDFIFDILKSDHIALNEMLEKGTYAQNQYSFIFKRLYKQYPKPRTKIDQKIVDYFYNKKNGVLFILLFYEHFDNKCLNNLSTLCAFIDNLDIINSVFEINGDSFIIKQKNKLYKVSWPSGEIIPDENGYIDIVKKLFKGTAEACRIPFKNNNFDYSKPFISKNCKLYLDETLSDIWDYVDINNIVFDKRKQIIINDKEYFLYNSKENFNILRSTDGYSFIRFQGNLRVFTDLNFYYFNNDITKLFSSRSSNPNKFSVKNILELKDYYLYVNSVDKVLIDKKIYNDKHKLREKLVEYFFFRIPVDDLENTEKILIEIQKNDIEEYNKYRQFIKSEISSQLVLHTKSKKQQKIEESSKAIFKKTQQLLQEEVFGAQAFVYHGSRHDPSQFIPMMLKNEFDPGQGAGAMYGKGLYCVHDLDDSATESGNYGSYLYKFKVNLHGYIIFDDDIAKKVYGKYLSPAEQAKVCGYSSHVIKFLEDGFQVEADREEQYSSDIARPASKVLSGLVKGLVFTGRRDGRVVVVYDASTAIPIAHKNLNGGEGWIKVDKQSLKDKLLKSASGDFDKEKYGKNNHMLNRLFKNNLYNILNKIYEDNSSGLSLFSAETDQQAELVKIGFPSLSARENELIKQTILIAKDKEYGILAYDYYGRLIQRYENKLNSISFNVLEPFYETNEIIKSLSDIISPFINRISQQYSYEKLPDGAFIKKEPRRVSYFDKHYRYHRDDGPAVIDTDSDGGRVCWYRHGEIHRDDGPAIISPNDVEEWYKNGKKHRDNDLPAVVQKDGVKIWYRDGQLHRSNGPAVINEDGTEAYFILGRGYSKEKYDEYMANLKKAPIQIDEKKSKTNLYLEQKNKNKFNNKSMNLFQLISEEIYK